MKRKHPIPSQTISAIPLYTNTRELEMGLFCEIYLKLLRLLLKILTTVYNFLTVKLDCALAYHCTYNYYTATTYDPLLRSRHLSIMYVKTKYLGQ